MIKKYLENIGTGVMLNICTQLAPNFGLGFASLFFKLQGMPLGNIMLIWAIGPFVGMLIARFCNTWHIKRFMMFGLLAYTGMALSLVFYHEYSYIIYAICSGMTLGFYWVSLNYIFFGNSHHSRHAKDSSIYFIIGPLIAIILPPLGALTIDHIGFQVLFMLTGLLSLIPVIAVSKKVRQIKPMYIDYIEAEKNFTGLKTYTALNGALHFFQGNFLTIYILLFFSNEYEIGGVLSYLALISLIISLMISNFSDKTQKRRELLIPISLLMGLLIIIMPSINNSFLFVIFIGIFAALDNVSLPLRFAIALDSKEKDIGFWRVSEVYLNAGRTLIFCFCTICIFLGNYWIPFIVFAAIACILPFSVGKDILTQKRSSS